MVKRICVPGKVKIIEKLDDSFLDQYKESLNEYSSERARSTLDVLSSWNENLIGSSVFSILQASHLDKNNPGFFPNGLKPVTIKSLREANKEDLTFLGTTGYTDVGLVLLSRGQRFDRNKILFNPQDYFDNEYLTTVMEKQLKNRNIKIGRKGLFIPFSALSKPREDPESEYGLSFSLNESMLPDDLIDVSSIPLYGDGFFRKFYDRGLNSLLSLDFNEYNQEYLTSSNFWYSSNDGRIEKPRPVRKSILQLINLYSKFFCSD
ncbi:hypothetical protein J4456_01230 [Candidatus Pacearchaeota archaeon]|nr:hypothetical protein [Candidatus Pacearchaeota archaeon]